MSFGDFFNDDLRARGKSNHKFRALDELDKDLPWLNYAELNPVNSKSQDSISDAQPDKDLSSNTTFANPSSVYEDVQNMQNELSVRINSDTAVLDHYVSSKDLISKQIHNALQSKGRKPCELCGFDFLHAKNPYQQWIDHFSWKHYRERIEAKLLGSLCCPLCDFVAKKKHDIYRHFGGKHKMIEKYISEDIANGTFIRSTENQDLTSKTKSLPVKNQLKRRRFKPWKICVLCDYEQNPKSKNRARQRLDHLASHYQDKIDLNLLAYQVNFSCPVCEQIQTSKGQLYKHYTRTHRIGEIFLADDIAAGRVKDLKQKPTNGCEVVKNAKSVEVTKDAIVTKVAKNTNVDKDLEVTTGAIAIDAQLTTAEKSKPHTATQSEISKTTGSDVYEFTESSAGSKSPLKETFKNSRTEVSQKTISTSHDDQKLLESGNSEQEEVQVDLTKSDSHGQKSSAAASKTATNPQPSAVRIFCTFT